jgi:mono/diheme cytochrome c family protein
VKSNILRLCILTVVSIFMLLSSSSVYSSAEPVKGEQLYTANCAKCHGREGEGFLRLYPPIHDSKYLRQNVSKLPCIIRNGLKGEITIGEITFNQIMPAIQTLKPTQMSHTITFMQQKWNHPVTDLTVSKWLEECSSR